MASHDSDSDSLPHLSKIFDAPKSSGMSRGDIVWAKFKHLYWPALVRAIYPKQKKITIWYADVPGKTFKLPLKNVASFHDDALKVKIKEDAKKAGCINEHNCLTDIANRYLVRRMEGFKDDPLKFFKIPAFVLAEREKKRNPDEEVSDMKICSTKNLSEDSESTESEGEPEKERKVDLVEEYLASASKPFKKDFIDQIVAFILSGDADDYLNNILSKERPSEYRDMYEDAERKKKITLSSISLTGPVEDDDQIRTLIFYLLKYYKNIESFSNKNDKIKWGSSVQLKCTLSCSSSTKIRHISSYIANVWLPESIIYAISVIKNISLSEAKQLFNKKHEVKKEAREGILASLDSSNEEEEERPSSSANEEEEERPSPSANEEEDRPSSSSNEKEEERPNSSAKDDKKKRPASEAFDDTDTSSMEKNHLVKQNLLRGENN